jgi:hypothetical protein
MSTTTTTAPATSCTDPKCYDDLPCEACVAEWLATNRPEELLRPTWSAYGSNYAHGIGQDARPHHDGAGTGQGRNAATGQARPATDRQLAYLSRLAQDSGQAVSLNDLTATEASALIEQLAAAAATAPAQADADGELTGRWTKHDGEWAIRTNRTTTTGETVTVVKANGDRQTKTTDRQLDADGTLWTAATTTRDAGTGTTDRTPGTYHTNDGRTARIQTSRTGNLYALAWDGETWTYEPGLIAKTTTRLTLDEAQAHGRETGSCCHCGRTLTNPTSIDAGIGPVCAENY